MKPPRRPFSLMNSCKSLLLLIFVFFLGSFPFSVKAEDAARVDILAVHTENFPLISIFFDVYDAQGNFVSAMDAESLALLEDGVPHLPSTLTEEPLPAQIVVAFNPASPMAVRDAEGVSRYDKVSEALQTWASALPAENMDDMSLVSTAGALLSHQSKEEWLQSLEGYHPDFQTAIPNIQSLAFAIDIASEAPPQEGMKRSVLFITSHLPDQAALNELETQTTRATQNGIRVNVWLIDSETYFYHESANALKTLALQTGGAYFAFSGEEPFPDIDSYFSPLRHVYYAEYTSTVSESGTHTLAAQIQFNGESLVSEPASFGIEIEPPNPILLSPPLQVLRQPAPETPYDAENLVPLTQEIEMMVEFPDGHPRDLVRSALYVDGNKVAENTAPPFDKFTWDLSEYTESGDHSLQVEVEDVLGLSKTSLGVPINVTVTLPPTGIRAFLAKNSQKITLAVIFAAGILLAGILLLGGKPIFAMLRRRREERQRYRDPATQPVERNAKTSRKRVFHGKTTAPARLEPMTRAWTPRKGSSISLADSEWTIGTDPVRAAYILDDPSISPLHAKIHRREDGRYLIFDAGSIAGTWVNFEPVPSEGRLLSHGDRIDFGQKTFRFAEANPSPPPQPTIQEEDSQS